MSSNPAPGNALGDQQIIDLIVLEVGDVATAPYPSGLLAANAPLLWQRFQDKRLIAPRLQEMYTKRACIDLVVGVERARTDVTLGTDMSDKRSQRFAALDTMRRETQAEIVRLERLRRVNRAPAVGAITATEPIAPPSTLAPDANDQVYRGNVYQALETVDGDGIAVH